MVTRSILVRASPNLWPARNRWVLPLDLVVRRHHAHAVAGFRLFRMRNVYRS
jgi:hypothetical protein